MTQEQHVFSEYELNQPVSDPKAPLLMKYLYYHDGDLHEAVKERSYSHETLRWVIQEIEVFSKNEHLRKIEFIRIMIKQCWINPIEAYLKTKGLFHMYRLKVDQYRNSALVVSKKDLNLPTFPRHTVPIHVLHNTSYVIARALYR
jgi:hypothetical protein